MVHGGILCPGHRVFIEGGGELDDTDRPEDADIGDIVPVREVAEAVTEPVPDPRHRGAPVSVTDQVQRRGGDRTGQRIGHEGGPVHQGPATGGRAHRVRHGGGGEHGGEGEHASGERLADAEDVRGDPCCGGGEQVAGASETGGDLVGDEQDAVGVADPSDAGDEGMVVEAHASGTLDHRLDDDGGDGVVDVALEDLQIALDLPVTAAADRRGGREDLSGEGACPQGVHATVGVADGHRAEGVAVVSGAPGQ